MYLREISTVIVARGGTTHERSLSHNLTKVTGALKVSGDRPYERLRNRAISGSVCFGITPVTFRLDSPRSTIPLDCAFRGGIRGWVNVSPNQDGRTSPTLTG